MKTISLYPSARIAFAASVLLLAACAAQQPSHEGYAEPIYNYQRIVPEDVGDPPSEVYDP